MDSKKNLNRRTKRSKGSEESLWDCSVCTYRNNAEAFKCLMCDVRKGTSTRKPRINPQLVQQVAQQYTQVQPKQKSSSSSSSSSKSDREKKSIFDRGAKKIRPRLKNIDRSSAQQKAVTVNNVTVIITEFQPKRRLSTDTATNGPASSSGNSTDGSQSDSASHSDVRNGDVQLDRR